MKIFLDTANLADLRKGASGGIVDGVTTKPTAPAMIREGKELARIHGNIVVKCLVRHIVQIYKHYGFKTRVLAASLRSPTHVVDASLAGSHIGTMPFKVLDKGLDQFLKDYAKVFQETPVAG